MGAPLVPKTKVWIVQLVVACALILAASLYAMTNLNMMPGGGTTASLPLTLMVIAIIANFVFGVLLNFGIGEDAFDQRAVGDIALVERDVVREQIAAAR